MELPLKLKQLLSAYLKRVKPASSYLLTKEQKLLLAGHELIIESDLTSM